MDKYQKFGVFILTFALFFMLVVSDGSERILFFGGIGYGLVFIFHHPIKRFILPKVERPLLAYGTLVVMNGLFMEVLAYASNLEKIKAGESAYLFATSSLGLDLLISLPYYITFTLIFSLAVKKYAFSVFQLGFVIWLGQAMSVDIFSHFFELLSGNILGFALAGILMLFTLHAPILLFENKFQEIYPNRNRSWIKYPIVFFLQILPLAVTFIIVFIKFNVLPNL